MSKRYKMPELENIKVAFDKFAEETKEFLQKPRYVYCEDKKYIVDTELDVLVDIDGVIDRLNTQCFQKKEFLRNIRIKNKQIADLEAKLAESEKQIKDAREAGNMAVDSWCKNRRKYEAQIAEMQNKSFILYSMLYETLEKQGCDNVASQIDQMTGWTYDKEADWLKGNRNYDQLKQQLAEKDLTIENWQTMYESVVQTCHNDKEEIERLNKQLAEKDLKIIELETKLNLKDKGTNV